MVKDVIEGSMTCEQSVLYGAAGCSVVMADPTVHDVIQNWRHCGNISVFKAAVYKLIASFAQLQQTITVNMTLI